MRIALVHEFLNQLGGAERVLENFLEIWPDADLHVILYDGKKTNHVFEKYSRKVSWLNSFPLAHSHHRLLLPWMPKAIESFDFSNYDIVFSDSSSFAKGAIAKDKLHICYCHTPTRFLWTEPEYLKNQKYPETIKWLGQTAVAWIKKWDYRAAQRPNFFIANSKNVQNRIREFYHRDSVVIYPPVDTEFFKPNGVKGEYFLVASRLEPYKKVDLVIQAFNELGLPLKIAGTGTVIDDLKKIAQSNIEFLGRVSDDELRKLYSEARAYIFPAEEDAGISMLESQACGTPVVAYKAGGALELVKENISGVFFAQQTVEGIKQAVLDFKAEAFDSAVIREHAKQFDKQIFQKQIKEFVTNKYENRS